MSMRGSGENGTCSCANCQRAATRTPAQKAIRKYVKLHGKRPRMTQPGMK